MPAEVSPPRLPICEDLPRNRRGRGENALRARISDLIAAWLGDANLRVTDGVSLDRSPLAIGPTLLFAIPVANWSARVTAAEQEDWQSLSDAVRKDFERAMQKPRKPKSASERLVCKAVAQFARARVTKGFRQLEQADDAAELSNAPQQDAQRPALVTTVDQYFARCKPQVAAQPAHPAAPGPSAVRQELTKNTGSHSVAQWNGVVHAVVKRLGAGSAPGPCGLQRDLLLQMCNINANVVAQLAQLVDHALAGRCAGGYLTDSTLSLVRKPGGNGWRPLGVGTLLRRISGHLAAKVITASARTVCEPRKQMALSENGTIRLHRQVAAAASRGEYVVSLDVRNAFNTLHRSLIMETIAEIGGAATPLCLALYGQPSKFSAVVRADRHSSANDTDNDAAPTAAGDLVVSCGVDGRETASFWTQQGVVQGCPLAPLLFATTVARAMPDEDTTSATVLAFHDDMYVCHADAEAVARMTQTLQIKLSGMGLELQLAKCIVVPPRPTAPLPITSPELAALFSAFNVQDGIRCMGGPIAAVHAADRVDTVRTLWKNIMTPAMRAIGRLHMIRGNPQLVMYALRYGGMWTRTQHAAYVTGEDCLPDDIINELEQADATAVQHALGIHGHRQTPADWLVISLPTSLGGQGIAPTSAYTHARRPHVEAYLDALDKTDESVDEHRKRLEAACKLVDKEMFEILYNALPANQAAHLNESSGRHAAHYKRVHVNSDDDTLIKRSLIAETALALSCGVRVLDKPTECVGVTQQGCRGAVASDRTLMDTRGDHAFVCLGAAGLRHFKVVSAMHDAWVSGTAPMQNVAREVTVTPSGELKKHGIVKGTAAEPALRQGDIAYRKSTNDKWQLVDFTTATAATTKRLKSTTASAHLATDRKSKSGPHKLVAQNANASAVIISQGTHGGMDHASYTRLREFVVAANIVPRDDGQDPVAILAARMQIACYTTAAELIASLPEVQAAIRVTEMNGNDALSGPPAHARLAPEDQRAIHAIAAAVQASKSAGCSKRWIGEWERYCPDVLDETPRQARCRAANATTGTQYTSARASCVLPRPHSRVAHAATRTHRAPQSSSSTATTSDSSDSSTSAPLRRRSVTTTRQAPSNVRTRNAQAQSTRAGTDHTLDHTRPAADARRQMHSMESPLQRPDTPSQSPSESSAPSVRMLGGAAAAAGSHVGAFDYIAPSRRGTPNANSAHAPDPAGCHTAWPVTHTRLHAIRQPGPRRFIPNTARYQGRTPQRHIGAPAAYATTARSPMHAANASTRTPSDQLHTSTLQPPDDPPDATRATATTPTSLRVHQAASPNTPTIAHSAAATAPVDHHAHLNTRSLPTYVKHCNAVASDARDGQPAHTRATPAAATPAHSHNVNTYRTLNSATAPAHGTAHIAAPPRSSLYGTAVLYQLHAAGARHRHVDPALVELSDANSCATNTPCNADHTDTTPNDHSQHPTVGNSPDATVTTGGAASNAASTNSDAAAIGIAVHEARSPDEPR